MIVEDGSIVPDANSYVDLAYADAYFTTRRVADWATLTDDEKEGALINATDFVEITYGSNFKGEQVRPYEQALAFPRVGVWIAPNVELPSDEIPKRLKDAVCDLAFKVSQGTELIQDQDRVVIKEKIAVIETTYQEYSDPATRFVKSARMLSALLKTVNGATISFAKLERG
jgi:hypothetical protein